MPTGCIRQDLLRDNRHAGIVRHLRRIYPDQLTGKPDWHFVVAPEGGIMGLHSTSQDTPFKQAHFPESLKDFEGKQRYADWVFGQRPLVPKAAGDGEKAGQGAGTPKAGTGPDSPFGSPIR